MRKLRIATPLILLALLSFVAVGCSSKLNAYQLEIVRAFETGALKLDVVVDTLDDGFSTFYRAHLEERYGSIPEFAGPVVGDTGADGGVPGLYDVLRFSWTVDGRQVGSKRELMVAFAEPGKHTIGVAATLGNSVVSSSLRVIEADSIGEFIPTDMVFLTLPDTGSYFAVPGTVVGIRGEENSAGGVRVAGSSAGASVVVANTPGFYLVTSERGGERFETNVFVSPVPSYHVDRVDYDWYYTQFRTLTTSNCGPTVVSMGIAWAKGEDVPVAKVRSILGWNGSGAVSMPELKSVLDRYDVTNELHWIESPDVIFDMLDAGSLVGVVYDMAGISFTENAGDNLFGQYYVDHGGHYLMIKGYSLDREYFVVYDPIPSDWVSNSKRYGDGLSMFGRNRYYDVDELFAALRSLQIIEIRK